MPVLATTLAGGLLVLAAYAGSALVALTVVALAALLAYGLLSGGDLPEPGSAGALIMLTAAGASLAMLLSDAEPGAETSFAPVLRALGPAIVAVLLVVLARPSTRERAVHWLAGTGAGVVLAALAAAWVALERRADLGPELIAITAVAAVIGVGVGVPPTPQAAVAVHSRRRRSATGWWRRLRPIGWLAAGAGASFLVPVGQLDATDRLVLAVAAAVAAGVASTAVSGGLVPASRSDHWPIRAALVAAVAVAVAAPVAAITVRVLVA